MHRFTKSWEVEWRGHHITVRNWWDLLLRTGEELIIDGEAIRQDQGWGNVSHRLTGEILAERQLHRVHVEMGSIDWGHKAGCHIFVDGELVGGGREQENPAVTFQTKVSSLFS